MKKTFITSVMGNDRSYLAEFLLNKSFEVDGIKRLTSLINTDRFDHLYIDFHETDKQLYHGDLKDYSSIIRIIQEVQAHKIYNLAAQRHVVVSFETPEYKANSDILGALRISENIKILKLESKIFFYIRFSNEK